MKAEEGVENIAEDVFCVHDLRDEVSKSIEVDLVEYKIGCEMAVYCSGVS